MAGEVAGERLYVQIVADATGFRRDLQEKVKAAAETVRADVKVRAQVDAKQLAKEARRAAREAANEAAAKVRAEFSARQVRAALNNALREGTANTPARARVEFSSTQVRAALQRALREGSQGDNTPARARVEFSTAQVRTALNRAVRNATAEQAARARVEFSAVQVRAALQRALREGSQGDNTAARARVQFSGTQVRAALAAAIREGVAANAVTARVDFDPAQVRAALQRALRTATGAAPVRVRLAADVTRFVTEVRAARALVEGRTIRIRVDTDAGSAAAALRAAGVALRTLSIGPAIASGIVVLAGALTNLVGGLFAVVSAASQAAGTLAVLPGLFASLAQGIAVLAVGFSGIGGALQAMSAADKQAATTAQRSAQQQVNSAAQIAQAREGLANARQQAAQQISDAERQAARSIADAERARADAVRDAQRAEEDLARARARAREEIQQLAFALRGAAISEEQAEINLARAQERLLQAQQSAAMSPLDRRQAELDMQQAVLDLEEARDRTADLTEENERARRLGVESSDEVRQARERLADANRGVADAERELAETRSDAARQVARARQQAAQQISAAQSALDQALASTAGQAAATGAAANNLGYELSKLSPAARDFARFLHSTVIPALRDVRDSVQAAFLPRMQTAIRAAMPLLDTLEDGLVRSARTIGDLAIEFGELAGSPAFRRDTAVIMRSNDRALQSFGRALLSLTQALVDVMVVAAPFVERFAELVEQWAAGRAEAARTGRETGRMAAFFEKAWQTGGQLVGILTDLWAALRNVGGAATPAGDTMLDSLARGAERLREWTEDPANQERLREFFNNTVPVMEQFADLLGRIAELFGRLGEITGGNALDGLFFVLDKFVEFLNLLTRVPGSGTVLTTILILAGAGFGLGVLARALGKIGTNLGRLSRYTGVTRLFTMLRGADGDGGGRGRSGLGRLADDVERLTGEVEREIPKDREKRRAIDDVGGSADRARRPMTGYADDVWVAGRSAEQSAKKTSRFGRIIGGLKRVVGGAGAALAGLGASLLAIPGVGAAASKLGTSLKNAFANIKMPGGAGGAAKGGFLASALGGMMGKLPGFTAIVDRVRTWAAGLVAAIRGVFTGGKLATLVKAGAKGGAKGGAGGPLGVLGGVLAAIVGQIIGGGKGGARGAVGGAITGGATGAGIGAIVGSIVPGIGNILGAALGAVVGAVIGAITGGRWWTAIGRFFTSTLPNWILDQVRRLPGRLLSMTRQALGLGAALIAWAGRELLEFSQWLGRAALTALERLPILIIDVIFALPRLIAAAAARLPMMFGWLLDAAAAIVPRLAQWATWLPRTLVKAILGGAVMAGQAFGWLLQQAAKVPGLVLLAVRNIPRLIWQTLSGNPPDVFAWLRQQTERLRTALRTLMTSAMGGVLSALSRGLTNAANRARQHLAEITGNFGLSKERWSSLVRSTMNAIRSSIGGAMDWARSKVTGVLNQIRGAFRSARDYIASAWQPLGRILAGPVNWIGNNVYNRGIKWTWDRVAALVKRPTLPAFRAFASGGTFGRVLPGYTPGRDVHRFVSPTGGVLDMSGGEAVMVPEWTRAIGTARVRVWNKIARRGGPQAVAAAMAADFSGGRRRAFRTGGTFGRAPAGVPYQRFDIGGLFSGISSFLGAARDLFTDGLASSVSKVLNPILNAVAGSMGAGTWGNLLTAIPRTMVTPFLTWLTKVIEPKLGGDAKGVVKAAASMIGQGDDRGPNNNWITRKWGMPGEPWCAMFVSEAISKAKAQKYYPGHPSALVAHFVGAMKHVGRGEGRPGDLGAYRGSGHINIIEKNLGGGIYQTIGGNENALIRRSRRGGQSAILRPRFASGGVLTRNLIDNAVRLFTVEAPRAADSHEMNTPLVAFMNRLGPNLIRPVTAALIKSGTSITTPIRRDSGGPLPPGGLAYNGLNRPEWVLTPEAVDFLGGPRAVAAINASARTLHASPRVIPGTAEPAAAGGGATVNVYPQPRQSETEIATIAARKLGALLK